MQQTMDVSRETVANSQEQLGDTGVLLREWIEWCESTGRAAHAADLIERSRAEMRNQ
jgi:methylaspartate ammonia-lyase